MQCEGEYSRRSQWRSGGEPASMRVSYRVEEVSNGGGERWWWGQRRCQTVMKRGALYSADLWERCVMASGGGGRRRKHTRQITARRSQ